MKKTLIALAVLAASGASFAQVSVTGKLGYSFQKNANVAGGAANQGMQMADGDVNFTATEDLGGGMSITAKQALRLRGRDTVVDARDASLALTTGFGLFRLSSVETCSKNEDVLSGAVSLSTTMDSKFSALDICSNIDAATYAAPIGPVVAYVSYVEFVPGAGNASTLNAWVLGGKYTAGPLMAGLEYTAYKGDRATAIGNMGDSASRTNLYGTYDLGVAKLGLGIQTRNKNAATQYAASVAVPMGALTVGLDYAYREAQGAYSDMGAAGLAANFAGFGNANGDDARTYVGLGANYAMSKTTTLNVSYGKHTGAGANSITKAVAQYDNEYRIRLMKAF